MFDLGTFLFFLGVCYYIVCMCVGISTLEDTITKNVYWKRQSANRKIWAWLFIVFVWTPFAYVPFRTIMFVFSPKAIKSFFYSLAYKFER